MFSLAQNSRRRWSAWSISLVALQHTMWRGALQVFAHWRLILVAGILSAAGGIAAGLFGISALYLTIGLTATTFILLDYRVGVVVLILFMPISASILFPHELLGITGLNPINILLAATLASYLFRRFFVVRAKRDFVPRFMLWLFIVPVVLAGLHGIPHVSEIPPSLAAAISLSFDDGAGYFRDMLLKPLEIVVVSFLLAASASEMAEPQKLLLALLAAVWSMSLLLVVYLSSSGISASDAINLRGEFSRALGVHVNDLGRMYAVCYALLLFSLIGVRDNFLRAFILASIAIVSVALLMTYSRAGYLAYVLSTITYFILRRNVKTLALGALILPVFIFLLPGTVFDRVSQGFGNDGDANQISAGRTAEIWQPLMPDIARNFLLGGGLGATMWSDAMRSGSMLEVGHPHNSYLKALLDMGIGGLVVMGLAYWKMGSMMWRLRKQISSPVLSHFFEGATVALGCYLLVGMSGSSLDPAHEQIFLWFAFGLAYGLYLDEPEAKRTATAKAGV